MFDEYFTGWKPDREAHGGSLASYIEDLGSQTRFGVVLCAFDYPDAASRGDPVRERRQEMLLAEQQFPLLDAEKFDGEVSWRRPTCGCVSARGRATRAWVDRTNDGLSGTPADGISLPPKEGDFGTSRWAARRLGYINGVAGWKGA